MIAPLYSLSLCRCCSLSLTPRAPSPRLSPMSWNENCVMRCHAIAASVYTHSVYPNTKPYSVRPKATLIGARTRTNTRTHARTHARTHTHTHTHTHTDGLAALPENLAIEALQDFSCRDLTTIRNKSAYLMGCLNKRRDAHGSQGLGFRF